MLVYEHILNKVVEESANQLSVLPPVAYSAIKNTLIRSYPQALTMTEIAKMTGIKQANILLSTNYGIEIGELLRDATYHPACYKVNPDKVAINAADEKEPVSDEQAVQPAKKSRRQGVFKEIVTYLIQSGEHLTVDELLFRTGVKSNRQTLSTTLSTRYAQKAISREAGAIPYRYFVADHLKAVYLKKYDIQLNSENSMEKQNQKAAWESSDQQGAMVSYPVTAQIKPRIKRQSNAIEAHQPQPVKKTGIEQYRVAVTEADKEGQSSARASEGSTPQMNSFDATINMNGMLTLIINDQPLHLTAEQTRMLAKLIKFTAE